VVREYRLVEDRSTSTPSSYHPGGNTNTLRFEDGYSTFGDYERVSELVTSLSHCLSFPGDDVDSTKF
jgi:hypothetical protein